MAVVTFSAFADEEVKERVRRKMEGTTRVNPVVGASAGGPDTTPAAIFERQKINEEKAAQLCEGIDSLERILFDHGGTPKSHDEAAPLPSGMLHQFLSNERDIEGRLDYANSIVQDLLNRLNH